MQPNHGGGLTGLKAAAAAFALAVGGIVAVRKGLVAHPGAGLLLVLAAVLPFVAGSGYPRLLRPARSRRSPGSAVPGSPVPGSAAPESAVPGSAVPGSAVPGSAVPGSAVSVSAVSGYVAIAAVLASATALLIYRPVAADPASFFFVILAARVAAASGLAFSIPIGVLAVALPEVTSLAWHTHSAANGAVGSVFAWVAGAAMRSQDRLTSELVAAQAALAGQTVAAERQQMAREFHDLVAHTLSVTMLHMTAVRLSLADHELDEAMESLSEAERAGREAMREMRQTVTLLGNPSRGGAVPALPRACDLPELVAGYASAGLNVDLEVAGELATVPGDAGLALYRIAQESLTNAAKHAADAATLVQVSVGARDIRLMVRNDLRPPLRPRQDGHGVPGMAQRAALLGGTLTAGQVGAAWRVDATLPAGRR